MGLWLNVVRILCGVLLLWGFSNPGLVKAERIAVDKVKVSVNEQVMTDREVKEVQGLRQQQLSQQFKGEVLNQKLKEMNDSLLRNLIEDLLISSHAERLNIEVSDKEIEERVAGILRREPKMANVYSEEQIKIFVLKDLLRQRVIAREVDAYLAVNETELLQACKDQEIGNREIDVGHILLRGEEGAILPRLEALRKKLLEGADFETMALEESEDPSAKRNKGRLGFITPGQFVKPFEEQAFSMGVGELSGPVKTQFGYHLIKVFAERSKAKVNCDEMDKVTRQSLHNKIYGEHRKKRMREFLNDLGKKADIQVFN